MTSPRGPGLARPLVLYDGTCGFCTWTTEQALAVLPDRVDWEPFQTADLAAYGVSTAEVEASLHVVEPSGRVSHGSAAMARVLVVSGAPWSYAGRLLLAPPVSWLAEGVYRVVAMVRARLPGVTPALARLPQDRLDKR